MTCLIPFAVTNSKDVSCELRAIVRYDVVRKSHAGKQRAQRANGFLSSSVLHHEGLRPLAVGINHYHEHLSLNWSSKIDVSLPGKSRVLPPMQGCTGWIICYFLTSLAVSDCPFYVLVDVWPPNKPPGQALHLDHTNVPLMKCFQNSLS